MPPTAGLQRRDEEPGSMREGEENDECEETNFMSLFFPQAPTNVCIFSREEEEAR